MSEHIDLFFSVKSFSRKFSVKMISRKMILFSRCHLDPGLAYRVCRKKCKLCMKDKPKPLSKFLFLNIEILNVWINSHLFIS